MIGHGLREFVDRVMDRHAIDDKDIKVLFNEILPETVIDRDAVDVLLALERAVCDRPILFGDLLAATVVDFAVWQSRPTGRIDRDTAFWLVTTLSAGIGPTEIARRIAVEILREAESCDEILASFASRRAQPFAPLAQQRMLLAS